MTIPAGYEDKIHILEEGKKATKPRKRTRKSQPALDSSAKASAPATSNDTASVGVEPTPVASTVNGTMNPPVDAPATAEDAPASGDDSAV